MLRPSSHIDAEQAILEQSGFFKDRKELVEFRYQLKSWPQTVGRDYRMEVTLDEGKEFSWNWQENKVTLGIGYIDQVFRLLQKKHPELPEEQIKQKTLEALYGAAIHEGLHRKYTVRPSELLDKETMRELFTNVGFAHMNNSIEDPRINTTCSLHYPALFPKIHAYIEADFIEGGDLAYGHLLREKIGWIPRFSQCGAEYMMFWEYLLTQTDVVRQSRVDRHSVGEALDAFLRAKDYDLDPRVEEVLRKTAYDMVRSFMAIPQEETIFAMSKKSMQINKDVIWPIFKELAEADQEKMEQNEMVNDMLQQLLDAMGETMAQQFLQELMEQMQGKPSEGSGEQPPSLEDLKKELENMKEQKGQLPMDGEKLSPEMQEQLKEFMEQLPAELREALEQKAKESLEGIEDMLNCTLKPQGSPELVPSHQERKEAETAEQEAQALQEQHEAEKRELQKTVEEIKSKMDEQLQDKSPYEETYAWIQDNIDFAAERDRFRRLFMPNYTIKATLAETGSRGVDLLAAMQRKAAKEMGDTGISHEIWRNVEKPHQTSYAFTFLVDLSGSMDGEKINNTLKAIAFLNEIFADPYLSQVEVEILGFHTVPTNDVQREQFVFRSARDKGHIERVNEKIATMLKEVGTTGAHDNDDGPAIRWATERLARSQQKKKFLIVFSDGEPDYSGAYRRLDEKEDTKEAIIAAGKTLGRDPFCFFLGDGGHPEEYYNVEGRQNVLHETNPKHFIGQLSELVSVMIMYPNDYLRYVQQGEVDRAKAENDFRKLSE